MHEINLDTFVDTIVEGVIRGKQEFGFFLGAGCSVSSGIPTAGPLVLGWIRDLAFKAHGTSINWQEWSRSTFGIDAEENPARYYPQIMQKRFATAALRQLEVQRFVSGKDPSFGYGALAALMSDERTASWLNVVVTTNFDDLVADALHLFYHVKPLTVHHSELAAFAHPNPTFPLVVKVHGDALLQPRNIKDEIARIPQSIGMAMQRIFARRGLAFIGYGGNDEGVADLLAQMGEGTTGNGIFWVNDTLPGNRTLQSWLDSRNAYWVKYRDFDSVMMLLHTRFGLEHPRSSRFDMLMEAYSDGLAMIERRASRDAKEVSRAARESHSRLPAVYNRIAELRRASTIQDPSFVDQLFDQVLREYPNSGRILGIYAQHLKKQHKVEGAAEYFRRALDADPDGSVNYCHYASFLIDIAHDLDEAERILRRAVRRNPFDPMALGTLASFLWTRRGDLQSAEAMYNRALHADFTDPETLAGYANFVWRSQHREEEAVRYYERSLDLNPASVRTKANFAQLLFVLGHFHRAERFARTGTRSGASATVKLESHFYLFAHGNSSTSKQHLQAIRVLVKNGVRSPDWDLQPTIDRAKRDGNPRIGLLQALADVITKEAPVETLDAFSEWQQFPA